MSTEYTINSDVDDIAKAVSDRYLVQQGFNIARTGQCVSPDAIDNFVGALQVDGWDVYDLRGFDGTITAFSENKNLYLYIMARPDLQYTDIYVKKGNVSAIVAFFQKYKKYFTYESPEFIRIDYHYYHPTFGSNERTIRMQKSDIQTTIPELYPDYDVAALAEQYCASNDNILLLYGPPGVGKTQFLRYVMKHGKFENIIYVKDSDVLNSGEFWVGMADTTADLMVFDDMDDALQPRKKVVLEQMDNESDKEFAVRKLQQEMQLDNKTFMRNILSFTDGIFEKKTKIIITTNQEIPEIDSAIIRPGRCFDFLTLNPLTFEEAQRIWTDVLKNDVAHFAGRFSGETTITQATLMSEHQMFNAEYKERTYVRRGERNYSLESKIRNSGVTIR